MNRSSTIAAALAVLALASSARADDKRPLPDYDGRGSKPTTPGDAAIVTVRVLTSPAYFVSEYVVRRPIGALIAGAERAGLPGLFYDFFTFGPDHKAGIVPTAYVDFGFRPSVGVYAFWDDAFAAGHDLRLHASTWGADWLAGSISERVRLSKDPLDRFVVDASALRRPDYAFYGLGPRTLEGARSRYGMDTLAFGLGVDEHSWRASSFHASVGVKHADFHDGNFGSDPPLDALIASGALPAPPGYVRGYTAVRSSVAAALDTRRPRPAPGSGVRVEIDGEHASDLRQTASWVTYGAAAGGFLDLDDRGRVVSLSATARFVDPVGHGAIPFTELAMLGGTTMRGFYPGRMLDRSAATASLAYRWPIWVWLDGSMRVEAGNVFGEHLSGFAPKLLRMSGSIGVESVGSPDNSLQILFGVGSETFDQGAKIDSFRLAIGTTHGL